MNVMGSSTEYGAGEEPADKEGASQSGKGFRETPSRDGGAVILNILEPDP